MQKELKESCLTGLRFAFASICVGFAVVLSACSGGGSEKAQATPTPTPTPTGSPGITLANPQLGFSLAYPVRWSVDHPCVIVMAPFEACSTRQRYRSTSPGETTVPQGEVLFIAAIASPGDPEIEILSRQPFNGVIFSVRRLPSSMTESQFLARVRNYMPPAIASVGASLHETSERQVGGLNALTFRYELKSWGPCVQLGAAGCSLATGRTWDQALFVQDDLAFLISCEGASQRSRYAKSGPPTLEAFDVVRSECQLVFDSFTLMDPQPGKPSGKAARDYNVPGLLSPAEGAVVPQNAPLAACEPDAKRGYGYQIQLDWRDSGGEVDYYELVIRSLRAAEPIVDIAIWDSEYVHTSCHAFVSGDRLEGWVWQVRAVNKSGVASDWASRSFRFAPCWLPDGSSCRP